MWVSWVPAMVAGSTCEPTRMETGTIISSLCRSVPNRVRLAPCGGSPSAPATARACWSPSAAARRIRTARPTTCGLCGGCSPERAVVGIEAGGGVVAVAVGSIRCSRYEALAGGGGRELLNSEAITEAIRPFNPPGEFGARHLHTLSTYANHRIRHGIRHTAALAGRRHRPPVPNDRLRNGPAPDMFLMTWALRDRVAISI